MRRVFWAGLLTLLLAMSAMAAKLSWTIENAAGEPQDGLTLQLKVAGTSTVVASTTAGTILDNGDGSYITSDHLASGEYSVYSGSGSGTLVPALAYLSHVDPVDVPTGLPVALTEGGTGATTASAARTNLGLAIGSQVQGWNAHLDRWNTLSAAALAGSADYFPYWNTTTDAWTNATASAARTALGLSIGLHVQAYDADLTTLGALGSGARAALELTPGVHVQTYSANLTTLAAGGSDARTFLGLGIGTHVQAHDADLDALAGIAFSEGTGYRFPVAVIGDSWYGVTAAVFRTNAGLAIGSDVQAHHSALDAIASGVDAPPAIVSFPVATDGTMAMTDAEDTRTALELGTAAVEDVTATGESSKVAMFTGDSGGGGLVLPTRTSHLTANSTNLGKTYIMQPSSNTLSSGSWGIYTIGKNSNGIAYTYEVKTLVETTW